MEMHIKQSGDHQPANQVKPAESELRKSYSHPWGARQIRQTAALQERISHIPECPALESGVALESQVSWLK